MTRPARYAILYRDEVFEHLSWIEAKHHRLIEETIEERLADDPLLETRNRKPLRPNPLGDELWELRLGPGNRFRVIYEGDEEARTVQVVAIGVKVGAKLVIAGEEVGL